VFTAAHDALHRCSGAAAEGARFRQLQGLPQDWGCFNLDERRFRCWTELPRVTANVETSSDGSTTSCHSGWPQPWAVAVLHVDWRLLTARLERSSSPGGKSNRFPGTVIPVRPPERGVRQLSELGEAQFKGVPGTLFRGRRDEYTFSR